MDESSEAQPSEVQPSEVQPPEVQRSEVEPSEVQSFEAEQLGRNLTLLTAAALPILAIPGLIAVALVTIPWFAVFSLHAALIGSLLFALAWFRPSRPRRRKVAVTVSESVLTIGKRTVPRAALTKGVLVPSEDGLRVRLSKRGPDIELGFPNLDQASRFLSSLGFEVDQTVATFRTMSPLQSSYASVMGTTVGAVFGSMLAAVLGALVTPPGAFVGGAVGISLIALLFAPGRLEVGADGVLVRWLNTRRFISHGDIADVELGQFGMNRSTRLLVTLHLTSGEKVVIPTSILAWDDGKTQSIRARILAAREVYRRGGASERAMLLRGERSHAEWIADLRAREVVGLRTAAVPSDQLWRVVEDSAAEPLERAAAAIALGKDLSDPERERLRHVAKAAAAPKLRVVLEKACEVEDDELAEELSHLEKQARRAGKS
jgi:hypothetical protein